MVDVETEDEVEDEVVVVGVVGEVEAEGRPVLWGIDFVRYSKCMGA